MALSLTKRFNSLLFVSAFVTLGTWNVTAQEIRGVEEVDLGKLLVPFQFRDSPAPLEKRLFQISARIAKWCARYPTLSVDQPACLLPGIVRELQVTGATLSDKAFDRSHLMLTLASRLHPVNFARYYEKGVGFDSTYARQLVAQRLLREIWPHVLEAEEWMALNLTEIDNWIIPWMGAKTPWSFFLNLSRTYSCLDPFMCEEKRKLVYVLEEVATAVSEDSEYMRLLEASRKATASHLTDAKTDALYRQVLKTLSDDSNGNLLIFSSTADFSPLDVASVTEYLSTVELEMHVPLQNLTNFSGSACMDINKALTIARLTNGIEWAKDIQGVFECEEMNGRLTSVGGPAFRSLQEWHLLWKFNFFQLRLMIAELFEATRKVDEKDLKLRQLHEILMDIESVRLQVNQIQRIKLGSALREKLKPQMSYLYKYLMSAQESAADWLGKVEP